MAAGFGCQEKNTEESLKLRAESQWHSHLRVANTEGATLCIFMISSQIDQKTLQLNQKKTLLAHLGRHRK